MKRSRRQAGFILTVELLLIFTIVVIAVVVALAALSARFEDAGIWRGPVWVVDSSAPDALLIGKVLDLDPAGAPRVLRLDPNTGRSLPLGVRVDRFTSRAPVFYDTDGCVGIPWVHSPIVTDGLGVSPYHRMQGATYAVGAGGGLLRDDAMATPCSGIGCPTIASVWISEWTTEDSLAAGALPPAAGFPPESPCRDLVDAPLPDLVPAFGVDDPDTMANVLAPFTPPFGVQ